TIQAVAPYAQSAQRPMAYLDSLLRDSHNKGLKDAAAIQEELDKGRIKPQLVKTVTQHQYTQRPHHEDDLKELDDLMKEFKP
ncbi:MAG: hypothetical protein IJ461_06700, partial [Clostridia bacterium]|nr:hypothetical protein [Clostridia bacterium]